MLENVGRKIHNIILQLELIMEPLKMESRDFRALKKQYIEKIKNITSEKIY